MRPRQLDYLDTERAARRHALMSSSALDFHDAEEGPLVPQSGGSPTMFDLFDNDDDVASQISDMDAFMDAYDADIQQRREAAEQLGRQNLAEVEQQQQQAITSHFQRPSSTAYIHIGGPKPPIKLTVEEPSESESEERRKLGKRNKARQIYRIGIRNFQNLRKKDIKV